MHATCADASFADDNWTLRDSVATSVEDPNETHATMISPSIMCAGERESAFVPLLASTHPTLSLDTTGLEVASRQPYEGPQRYLTVPQTRALSSYSQIGHGNLWDVYGSTTAAVLSENRFSTISSIPTTPETHVEPSLTPLQRPRSASVALEQGPADDTARVQAMGQKATHNPFRARSLRRSASAAYPTRSETAPPMLIARRTIYNPFRHPSIKLAQIPDIPLSLQPGVRGAAPLVSLDTEVAQPSPRKWDTTGEPSPWMLAQAEIACTEHLHVPQTSWSTESLTQSSTNSKWPAMSPEASQRECYADMRLSSESGNEVVFFHAI